jgi:hypothetical protein
MPGMAAASSRSPIKMILTCLLLLVLTLASLETISAQLTCSGENCGTITASPGKYALTLGEDFPTFGPVKLSYPNSSILTSSVGDLLFLVNLTINKDEDSTFYRSVDIYIPPDFTGLTISKVWSSFTNDYDPDSISLGSGDSSIGPNWSKVSVKNLNVTSGPTDVANRTFEANQPQYIRIFQVTSPSIAGRYFFKVFINGASIGAENFPTVVVKASRDPAYISGVLRDADNTSAGQPISILDGTGARILATGIDYLGRSVAAQTFINYTAKGSYTLFGVAPGTYNITAYASGYIPTTRPTSVSVLSAQSLVGVDIYMKRSVNITGTVLSRSSDGLPIEWQAANRTAVRVEVLTLDGSVVGRTPAPNTPFKEITNSSKDFPFYIQWQVDLDGRIPQSYANYTSGLVAGDYLLQASVNSYIQLDESRIHVGNDTTFVRAEVRLIRTSSFLVTVHFQNLTSNLNETDVPKSGTLTVEAFDQEGNVGGRGSVHVPAGNYSARVEVPCPPGTYHIFARFTAQGEGDLFYQTEDLQATIGLGHGSVSISLAMVKSGAIDVTLYSVDTEKLNHFVPWAFPGAIINLKMVDSYGNVYTTNATKQSTDPTKPHPEVSYAGLLTGNYSIIAETFGYSQREITSVHVVLGGNSDISVWMVRDPRIDVTIVFKNEGLLSPVDSTLPFAQPINNIDSAPIRAEVFDAYGNFVGANVTYIPNPHSTVDVTLAGFHRYFGNPWFTWSGFYDTTDATRQDEGGLPPGDYLIRVWVDGYYQLEPISITLPSAGNVSMITSMERASRVSGIVLGPDLNDKALLLSWAIVDAEPGSFITFSLDGSYQLWVPAGSYDVGVSLPGYATLTTKLEVSSGSDITANFWLGNPQLSSAYAIGLTSIWFMPTPLGHPFSQTLVYLKTKSHVLAIHYSECPYLLVYLAEQTEPSSVRPLHTASAETALGASLLTLNDW